MVNAKSESNMLDIGKVGGAILTTSFHLYFLKLHSCNYTLPPLIKRRNRGVIFLFEHSLLSFPRFLGENPRPGWEYFYFAGQGFWVNCCNKCGDCGECGEKNTSSHFLQKFTASTSVAN